MSNTQIYAFGKDGYASYFGNIENSWRGAIAIWDILERKYLPPYIPSWVKKERWYSPEMDAEEIASKLGYTPTRLTTLITETLREVWDLVDDAKVSITDKIVLATTFDKFLVKQEELPRVIEAFNAFEGNTSLKEQAQILQRMYEDEDVIAVGWNQTTISFEGYINYNYDEQTGECTPYNCLTQNDHFWLFDEIDV